MDSSSLEACCLSGLCSFEFVVNGAIFVSSPSPPYSVIFSALMIFTFDGCYI